MKEEPVDILDENGAKTGQTLLKSEAHKKGLWHGGAHLWLYDSQGEVLLQLRSPKKVVKPNIWDVSVAGHIAATRTPLQTVVEEAKEELGLSFSPDELVFIGRIKYDDILPPKGWHHRTHSWVYAAWLDQHDIAKLSLEHDETSAVRWIAINELAKQIKDQSKTKLYSPSKDSYELAIAEIPKIIEARL